MKHGDVAAGWLREMWSAWTNPSCDRVSQLVAMAKCYSAREGMRWSTVCSLPEFEGAVWRRPQRLVVSEHGSDDP